MIDKLDLQPNEIEEFFHDYDDNMTTFIEAKNQTDKLTLTIE